MKLENKRFQAALDRINQNIGAARIITDLAPVEFHFERECTENKYNVTNRSTGVYLGIGVMFDAYPKLRSDSDYTPFPVNGIHRIGIMPEELLRSGKYTCNIWAGIETGNPEDKYKQFLNLNFDGNSVHSSEIGTTRSKAAPIINELTDLIQHGWKKRSNHSEVLRAIDLSFKILTFPDRDAIDLIGEIK